MIASVVDVAATVLLALGLGGVVGGALALVLSSRWGHSSAADQQSIYSPEREEEQ